MIVADSSVWITYLRAQASAETRRLEEAANHDAVIVGDIILLEVLRGASSEAEARRIEGLMRTFPVEQMLDETLAVAAAARYRKLRGLGMTVSKTADLIIASFCVSRGYPLLHRDRDFALIAKPLGLRFA